MMNFFLIVSVSMATKPRGGGRGLSGRATNKNFSFAASLSNNFLKTSSLLYLEATTADMKSATLLR